MYTQLLTEHETSCKSVIENHAKCGDLLMAMTTERDNAVKAHADCGAGAEGAKKQLEEKDAALKAATEKVTTLEAERDEPTKKVAGGGRGAEASKKKRTAKDGAAWGLVGPSGRVGEVVGPAVLLEVRRRTGAPAVTLPGS